jgi:hypothetical protein
MTWQRRSHRKFDLRHEAEYIVHHASKHSSRVAAAGPLLFFSSEAGDAWVLDLEDSLALPLARDGDSLPVAIREIPQSFAIEWSQTFPKSSQE